MSLGPISRHAVAVFIATPEGVPLVRDPKKPPPHFWKFPGGRSENDETATDCAVREIHEELGLRLRSRDLMVVVQQNRGTHTFTLFKTNLSHVTSLKTVGDGGEDVALFSSGTLLQLPDLFPPHRSLLQSLLGAPGFDADTSTLLRRNRTRPSGKAP